MLLVRQPVPRHVAAVVARGGPVALQVEARAESPAGPGQHHCPATAVQRDLKRDDFTVLEDNKPQAISAFDFEDLGTSGTPGAAAPEPPAAILGAVRQRGAAQQLPASRIDMRGRDIQLLWSRIACPTLVITTEGSALGPVEAMRKWQQKIPGSTLLALPGDSFHVAVTDSERCARETRDFMLRAGAR